MTINPNDYLTAARSHKRLAGWWAFWNGPPYSHGPGTIFCGKIARKDGVYLEISGTSERIRLSKTWVLPPSYDIDAHWPRNEEGCFLPLPGLEAKAAMIAAISEMAFKEEL